MGIDAISVAGVHSYNPSEEELAETLEIQWGDGLKGSELASAKANVQEHYDNLYLVELVIAGDPGDMDWMQVTQEIAGEPRENWQMPYDEQCISEQEGKWAFFFHFMDPQKPLLTQLGEAQLPQTSAIPEHLADVKYEAPG